MFTTSSALTGQDRTLLYKTPDGSKKPMPVTVSYPYKPVGASGKRGQCVITGGLTTVGRSCIIYTLVI
uniref:Uncharacterized protein n=1 Tax=Anguilla anguilla TaxID=7936 RepID=A0A0E9TZM1_ANGAN